MKTFIWDEHFTTGLASVDEQHQRLVDLINELGDAWVSGGSDGPDALEALFVRLTEYAAHHFADEERLMAAGGLDEQVLRQHRGHHGQFTEELISMWHARSSLAHPGEVLHGFLSAWLGFHILGEDQAMARQLAEIAVGVPPRVAAERTALSADGATGALLAALGSLYRVLSVQNRDLARAHAHLEERVAERTHALALANETLERISRTDALLGIANRGYLDTQLVLEWGRARRLGHPVAVLMLDVDQFKRFNDTYGHQAGDRCLQAVAEAAGVAVRRPGDLLARYGGEELAVVLPNTELAGALTVAAAILEAVDARRIPHSASPVAPHVTLSIGAAAQRPQSTGGPETLVALADAALYRAKEAGRHRVCAG